MRIILVGFGVVGRALVEAIIAQERNLLDDFGLRPRIVAALDKGGVAVDRSGLNLQRLMETKSRHGSVSAYPGAGKPVASSDQTIREIEAEIVVEVTPTRIEDPSFGIRNIEAALKSGKHVVTTNKGPLAKAYMPLVELASHNAVKLMYSGTVGGATPVIDLARKCMFGDKILSLRGILNGTTNYILTRMEREAVSFNDALQEAQKAGYAEHDPTYDISGLDTACKLVILSNSLLDKKLTIDDVDTVGIGDISQKEIERAKKKGESIRLIGSIDGEARVRPETLPRNHPLCIEGTLNAVSFNMELAGETILIGRGAGGRETACAIIRDIIEIRRSFLR